MQEVKTGDTITYKLKSSQYTRNPKQLWHGRVIRIFDFGEVKFFLVELLDLGYEGLEETIINSQVVELFVMDPTEWA